MAGLMWGPIRKRPNRLVGGAEVCDEDPASGAEHTEHLVDRPRAQRLGEVMDHQTAHRDVVRAVGGVEGFGDPL
jgi:hypothetical protein